MKIYYVEIKKWLRRDLVKPWNFERDHVKDIGEPYTNKKMARKDFVQTIKEMKKELENRKRITGNCHEKVVVERFYKDEPKWARVCIVNSYKRSSSDQMIIVLRERKIVRKTKEA